MSEPTRYEGGVTNAKTGMWAKAPFLDPRKYHAYFNDFDHFVTGDWTITNVGTTPTNALTDVDGGALLTTITAADNDSSFLQKKGESYRFEAGKKLFFECRFRVSDATQSDVVFGLQITDTTPLAVSDGVYFLKPDDGATVNLVSLMNSAGTTQAAVATLADATFIRLGFYFDGQSAIEVYVDDVKVATVAVTLGTTLCNDEDLTVSFGLQNGEAVAKNLTTDYILVAKER